MKETEKYGSKLYKPKKPYYKMSIQELSDHCKICQSLDKMCCARIKKIENLNEIVLQKKIKKFLERNNENNFIRKNTKKNRNHKRINTKKEKYNTKDNKKKHKKTKKTILKKNKTKKTNI
jgi:hypothetical protein